MKKIFTKLFYASLVFGIIQTASASSIDHSNSVCPTLSDVTFPGEVIISDPDLNFSTLTDELIPENLVLNYGIDELETIPSYPDPDNCDNLVHTYTDVVFNIDGVSFKVLRQWTVLDWFTGNLVEEYQIIRNLVGLINHENCTGPLSVSVNPWSCVMYDINPESFLDSDYTYENVTMTPEPSTGFGIGVHNITINATLDNEDIVCYSTLIIEDNTPPIAVANNNIQVALDENCTATITADQIDEGSHDGDCGDVTLSIEPSTFTAEDAGTSVTVTLTVVDEAGNSNIALALVEILPCSSSSIFQCIDITTVAGLNEEDIQVYAEDFLTPLSTSSGDLSLSITDPAGNVYMNGFIPQGSGISFLYELTDNVTGNSCMGIIQAPIIYSPCSILACITNVQTPLSSSGSVTIFPQDLLVGGEDCTDLTLEIFDEDSNLIASGTSITLDQTGTYTYQITNSEQNLCWATLVILEHTPCPTSLVCNDNINVSMYVPPNSDTPIAIIDPDMLLQGNYTGCDLNTYHIELNDIGIAGYYFEGTGTVEVNQESIYTYTLTDPVTGNSCWGQLNIENKIECPEISDVIFPEDLSMTILGITPSNISQELQPESLITNYGYTENQTKPTWPQIGGCNNLAYSYSDFVFEFDDDSFKIIRDWVVIDWLTGDVKEVSQLIENNITLGLICDFLPNSAEFGDCDSGHTMDDDVEWPDDVAIADYRIKPNDLVAFSQIDLNDSQPIIVNNANIYTMDYVDILQQLQVNLITVSRVWTISANGTNVATYNQILEIDITNFSSLVAVNTMTDRPVEGVQLTSSDMTNDIGVSFPSDIDNLNPIYEDDYRNGLTIKDIALTQRHILGFGNLSDYAQLAADLNNDDKVSAIDLIEINKSIIEISESQFSDWRFVEAEEDLNTINPSIEYIAIKPGDVDDDANLGVPFVFETDALLMEDLLINNGEFYETKLQYSRSESILGTEIHMYYDVDLIDVSSLTTNISSGNLSYNIDIPGEIHFTILNPSLTGFSFSGDNYVNLSFTAKANGLLSQAINVPSRNSYILDLDFELHSLDFEFVDQIGTGTKDISAHAEIFKVYPNPTSDNLTFDFIDKTSKDFKINIYNISGQLVSEHINQNNIDVSSLHSGMHFYRLTQDEQSYSGRFNVIK